MNEIIEKLKERLEKQKAWVKKEDSEDLGREDYVDGYRFAVKKEIIFLQECLSILKDKEDF